MDPYAGMEVMFWRDIRAMFMDAVYVRHNSRRLDFLKDANGNDLFPLRVAALHRAVVEVVVDAPLNLPAAHVQSRVATPPAPGPAPRSVMHRRLPPITSHIVPRSPVPPAVQQAPRPTARSIMGRMASHINLVLLEEKGEGDKRHFPKVLECYLKSVHKGHAYALFAVGKLYFDGKDAAENSHGLGVVQDYTKAMEWFIKAANLGDAGAQTAIGEMYAQSHGVSQDYQKAIEWLTKAADQGHALALTNIGMLYHGGHCVLQDHDKALEMQQQALDRLAVIQGRIQVLLAQTFELHEHPIPRLFIVLPKDTSERNPASLLANQFQLYFLCECGEHTKVLNGDNTNTPHHIHIAKHEGYDLKRPTEFFQKYGRYMLTLLEMIKHGSIIAGYIIPALTSVNVSRATDIPTHSQHTTTTSAINRSIEYLYTLSNKQDTAKENSANSFTRKEMLEGTDLSHLKVFIKSKDRDRALGDLYRIIDEKGLVKWVCINHYRQAYKTQEQQTFVAAVELNGGHYNPHLDKVTVSLGSKSQLAGFFEALAKARCVDELDVTFDWEGTTSDLEAFGNALENAAVSIVRLDLRRFRASFASQLQSPYTLQEALARCINLPHMKLIHIVLPMDLVELSNLQPKRVFFQPKLSFEVVSGLDEVEVGKSRLQRLAEILQTNSALITLSLCQNSIKQNGAVALSEALKTNSTLTTLILTRNSIGDKGAMALSEALKTNSTLTTLYLSSDSIGVNGAAALSEALKINSTLTTLNLYDNSIEENGALALSEALKTNSTLTTLDLSFNSTLTDWTLSSNSIGDNGAVALSEALKTNSTLTTLNLNNNSIGDKGALALSEALKTNSTLTTLDLSYNANLTAWTFWYNSIGDNGATALSEALKINSSLTALNLRFNSIRDNGAVALSEALKTNSTLTTLILTRNSIGDKGAVALSEALKTNSTLATLGLQNNSIGDKGAVALSEALNINSTVRVAR
ncbi:hypothetical protein BGZ95_000468 [Linnemannia exigua]|uniref:RNI-like protein n=1 Tax=Linnemannia exigua TaxID=604196 RepID=A0AAD4DAB0_9FUNG|nr:hypothetical protein BGZ95_000468 [Linnemannia exigua]